MVAAYITCGSEGVFCDWRLVRVDGALIGMTLVACQRGDLIGLLAGDVHGGQEAMGLKWLPGLWRHSLGIYHPSQVVGGD